MKPNLEKLSAMASARTEEAKMRAEKRKANRTWLKMSQDIALAIHYYLRKSGNTQKDLADKLGVSTAYVTKLMKGNENLTVETICKLQDALGEELVTVCRPYEYKENVRTWNISNLNFSSKSQVYRYSSNATPEYAHIGDAA